MYSTILVPVDGSKLSERALSLAIPLAEEHGARLMLVQVHEPVLPLTFGGGVPVVDTALDASHRTELRTAFEKLVARTQKLTAARVEGQFRDGRVVGTLLEAIAEHGAGLVVMSTHGRGGFQRFWLGSVTDALVRHVTVPVLLVRGARPPAKRLTGAPAFTRAVVPLDGSPRAERAVAAARGLFGRAHARLHLVHVVHPMTAMAAANAQRDAERESTEAYLAPLAARTATPTLEVRWESRTSGNVARTILESAEQHDADVIVIAGQGLSGVQRLLVGSVADKLIRTAPVPVLVVPGDHAT